MMDSAGLKSPLPVPFIPELNSSHSLKQGHRKQDPYPCHLRKPPKLVVKHDFSFSKSFGSVNGAHAISFRENGNETSALLSPAYKKDANLSYYEQRFKQISRLGEGSFGEVFKVRSRDDGNYYAIKKSKQYFRSEVYRQERLEEVRRYEQFSNHENCVTMFSAWEEDDRLFMQMELCQGTLEDYACDYAVKGQLIPEYKIWSFLVDLLLALKGLHDQNLVHLDVKLDNIMITEDEVCKLGDFGLVFDLNRNDMKSAIEGDSRYIAPELLEGNFTKAADIFSLGCCLLELSCNIELEANGPLWQGLRDGNLPNEFLQKLSPELQGIIKWMMEPNPNQRPNVNTLLKHPKIIEALEYKRRNHKWRQLNSLRRRIWRRMCNFYHTIAAIFTMMTAWLRLTPRRRKGSSDISTLSFDMDDNESSVQITPTVNASIPKMTPIVRIVNSTPLNSSGIHFRNRRKDGLNLSKTVLGFDSSDEDESSFSSAFSPMNSTPNGSHEGSSLICKKLFTQSDPVDE